MASVAAATRVEKDETDIVPRQLSHATVAVVGLFVIALGSLLATVPEPFIGPPATALSLAVAAVVWRFGRWMLLLSALYALPPLIISVALLSFTFIHLESFLQFMPLLLVLGIGSLMSLIAGTRAFVGYRRGHAAPVRPETARWWLRTAVVAVLMLSIASAVLAFAGRSTVAAGAAEGATEIGLKFPDIEPSAVEVGVGQTVRLLVRNDDWGLHTFTVAGLEVDYAMRPRSSRLIEFTPTEAGEYRYFCRVLGHDAMKGTLLVR